MTKYLNALKNTDDIVRVDKEDDGRYVVSIYTPSPDINWDGELVAQRHLDKNATELELDKLVESLVTYVPDLTGTYYGEEN